VIRLKNEERISRVRKLWLQRPESMRSENNVLVFHGELTMEHPELLNGRHGDSYQQLKVDLRSLVTD
jgi:hypothetical protein